MCIAYIVVCDYDIVFTDEYENYPNDIPFVGYPMAIMEFIITPMKSGEYANTDF